MQFLKVRFHSRDEFLEAYSRELANGGLFIPTTQSLPVDTPIVVDLTCEGLPNRVLLRAVVRTWRPAVPRLRIRAGALVEFEPEEREKREFVLAALGGAIKSPRKRKHTRIPVQIPLTFRVAETSEAESAEITEISVAGGEFRAGHQVPLDTDLVLSLMPPGGAARMEIAARVTHHTPAGGTGVRFLFRDGGGSRRLRELIRRIRAA